MVHSQSKALAPEFAILLSPHARLAGARIAIEWAQ